MRIAIVNDLKMAVEVLKRVVMSMPGYEIAWIAYDGREAVEKCARDVPDLILMDLIMPVMDGVEATCRIMQASPCAILVVTATVTGHTAKVFEAMGCGALDAVCTPVMGTQGDVSGAAALLEKIATLAQLINKDSSAVIPSPIPSQPVHRQIDVPLVAIGASTGGPLVLAEIFRDLPVDLPASFVVIQHLDAQFAPGFASWLAAESRHSVQVALTGDRPTQGVIFLAGTNDHLVLQPDLTLEHTVEPKECFYRPSVDAFFMSALRYWPEPGMAILLTGMGRDGAQGLLELRQAHWHTIAQDQESCVLYGMPKAAAELKAAIEVLPPNKIRDAIIRFVQARTTGRH